MCGIAGAVGYVDERIVAAVERMDSAQIHRGPDGHGMWISDALPHPRAAVLAHRRLAIIDRSVGGAQPMIDEHLATALVYNGETYNYRELRHTLERCGARFATASDTEVVLAALVHWGIGGVDSLRGMFALAAWSGSTRRLHLVRDRMGIKPLYYMTHRSADGVTVLFASELRALLASGLTSRTISDDGLGTYLWNGFVIGPETMIEGITLLPTGCRLTIEAGCEPPTPTRYWSLPTTQPTQTVVDELREELLAAVRMRLVADVPLGVFLSGGIDSSAVAALACQARADVRTFNIGFDDPQYDESHHARAVADALGTDHTSISLTEHDFVRLLPDALDALDQPTFDAVNTYCVSRAVREAGITVALAGVGGDELFGGYRSFVDVPRAATWSRRVAPLPSRLVHAAAATLAAVKTGGSGPIRAQTRWGKLGDALATHGDLLGVYQVSYSLFTRALLDELADDVAPAARTHYGLSAQRAGELEQLTAGLPALQAISLLELSCFVSERLLRDTDCASMAVSLEVRVPLLDHEIVRLVAGLNPHQRFEPLGRKMLLRRLALEHLDPQLFDRPKSGFVFPFDRWCRQALREDMNDAFHDATLCRRAGLNPVAVERLWRTFEAGSPGIYWSRVWALYVLLWWCQRHGVSR